MSSLTFQSYVIKDKLAMNPDFPTQEIIEVRVAISEFRRGVMEKVVRRRIDNRVVAARVHSPIIAIDFLITHNRMNCEKGYMVLTGLVTGRTVNDVQDLETLLYKIEFDVKGGLS